MPAITGTVEHRAGRIRPPGALAPSSQSRQTYAQWAARASRHCSRSPRRRPALRGLRPRDRAGSVGDHDVGAAGNRAARWPAHRRDAAGPAVGPRRPGAAGADPVGVGGSGRRAAGVGQRRRGRRLAAPGRPARGRRADRRGQPARGAWPQGRPAGRPNGPALCAPRRPAPRRPRGLGQRPVHPGRTGRAALRARRRRRQGGRRGAPGRAAGARRPAPGRDHRARRGRGGDRLAGAARVPGGLSGPARRRRGGVRRRGELDRGHPGADHHPARRHQRRRAGAHAAPRRAQRPLRRPGPRRADRAVPDAGHLARRARRRGGARPDPRLCWLRGGGPST